MCIGEPAVRAMDFWHVSQVLSASAFKLQETGHTHNSRRTVLYLCFVYTGDEALVRNHYMLPHTHLSQVATCPQAVRL